MGCILKALEKHFILYTGSATNLYDKYEQANVLMTKFAMSGCCKLRLNRKFVASDEVPAKENLSNLDEPVTELQKYQSLRTEKKFVLDKVHRIFQHVAISR